MAAIGTTFELARKPNPLYKPHADRQYWKDLDRQIQCYRNIDPPPEPKLAVPCSVPHFLVQRGLNSTSPKRQAVGDLCNIAFYYLLRVGEYTHTSSRNRKRTIQFRVNDVTFRRQGRVLNNMADTMELLAADEATLQITNQKNGKKGQCIHHFATGTNTCPIRALARRVSHILQRGGNPDSPISTYFNQLGTPKQVIQGDINTAIKDASNAVGLYNKGYDRKRVSSHSLRAGGAMALHLTGTRPETIQKMGRWSSDTFLMYIHEQISAFSQGLSIKMATAYDFNHIATAPTLLPQ